MRQLCDSYPIYISDQSERPLPAFRAFHRLMQLPLIAKNCQASFPACADTGDSDVGATIGEIAHEYKLRWVG